MDALTREQYFLSRYPKLDDSHFRITSAATRMYNCIAWAVGDDSRWWSFDDFELFYWPDGVRRDDSVESWAAALSSVGFAPCSSAELEEGFEKAAIYAVDGRARHVARQLATGKWTSKMGSSEDIEHDLQGIAGRDYGQVTLLMQRANPDRGRGS
jgi:hypothetical protein